MDINLKQNIHAFFPIFVDNKNLYTSISRSHTDCMSKPSSLHIHMSNPIISTALHEESISGDKTPALVLQYRQTAATSCSCDFGDDCLPCRTICESNSLVFDPTCCSICNMDLEYERSLARPPPRVTFAEQPRHSRNPQTLESDAAIAALRFSGLFEKPSIKVHPFDHSFWTEEYTYISKGDLTSQMRRPPPSTPFLTNLQNLDASLFELARSGVPDVELRHYINVFEQSRLKIIVGFAAKKRASSGTRRKRTRSITLPRFTYNSPSPKPIPPPGPSVAPPLPLLSDIITPPTDSLYIGGVRFSSPEEVADPIYDFLFQRNKSLRRKFIAGAYPLNYYQAAMAQKISSDDDFRSRAETTLAALRAHSLPPALQSSPLSSAFRTVSQLRGAPHPVDEEDEFLSERGVLRPVLVPPCPIRSREIRKGAQPWEDFYRSAVCRSPDIEFQDVVTDYRTTFCESLDANIYDITAVAKHGETALEVVKYMNMIARVGVTLNLVLNAPSPGDKIQIIYLYLSGFSIPEVLEMFTNLRGTVEFQSGPADLFLEEAFGLIGIANIFALFTGAPTSALSFMHQRFVVLARRTDGDDMLKKFWSAFKTLLKSFETCWKTGSINPLFESGSTPSEVLFEAECLITYRLVITSLSSGDRNDKLEILRKNQKVPSYWTRPFIGSEYLERLQEVLKRLDSVIPLVEPASRATYVSARSKVNTAIVGSVNSLSVNSSRIQPLGLAVTGKPGTGKSVFLDTLYQYIGNRCQYATDGSGSYIWKDNVNFQDGLNNGHWMIRCDDLDHNTKGCAPGVTNHVDAIMMIADNKPFPVESAEVSQKGTNAARPLLFAYATNNVDLRLATFSPHFAAVRRRLSIRLIVKPHPDFANGDFLDPVKARGKVNVHSIDIHTFDPIKGDYVVYRERLSTTEVLKYLYARFAANLEEQSAMLASTNTSRCVHCSIPLDKGLTSCEECTALLTNPAVPALVQTISVPLQGQEYSRPGIVENASKAAENLRVLTDRLSTSGSMDRVDRVLKAADGLVASPPSVKTVANLAVSSLAEFFSNYGHYVLMATAVIGIVSHIATSYSLQGRVNNSTQVIPVDYVKVSDVKPAGVPFKQVTYTSTDLVDRIRKNLATVESSGQRVYACRVGVDLFVTTCHSIGEAIKLEFRGISYDVAASDATVTRIGTRDLVLIKVPGVPLSPTILPMIWQELDASQTTFDEVYLVTPTLTLGSKENRIRSYNNNGYSGPAMVANYQNEAGYCGLPVVAVNGTAHRIVGFHHAGKTLTNRFTGTAAFDSYAPVVSRAELQLAANSLAASLQSGRVMSFNFPKGLTQTDLPGETRSELALAISKGAEVVNLGHDKASVGHSAGKSKCRNSLIYPDVEPFARGILGSPHYWQVPHLKGSMIDGHWHSGYQNIFAFSTNKECYGALFYPINDYCSHFEDLDRSGFSALSMDEAILGVDSSIIGPVNLRTSIGPPLVGPKSRYITTTGHVSPEVIVQMMEIEAALEDGEVPIFLSSVSLKDEPVKFSKNEKRDIRTINCMAASANLVAKKYMAPIKAFMRAYPFAFESMVGINMAKEGGQLIRERFSIVNPSLDNIIEGDFKKMDKTINGSCAWAVVEVFSRVADYIGVNPSIVRSLVWSQFHVIYSIHGDLYQVGAANPSGCDITVEINAVVNSLTHRAAWYGTRGLASSMAEYLERKVPERLFRDENSLVTYGDDFLLAVPRRFDLVDYFKRFEGCGMIVTDGQKLDKPIFRSFDQVSFLKRSFFLVDGYTRCGLNVASILRMLMISKPSSLSLKEQASICCEEALREVFLNSSLDFNLWRKTLIAIADKYSLWDSAYLRLLPYDGYQAMWEANTFSTWCIEKSPEEANEEIMADLQSLRVFDCFSRQEITFIPPTFQSQFINMPNQLYSAAAMGDSAVVSEQLTATTNLPTLSSNQTTPTPTTYGSMVAGGTGDTESVHASGNIVSLTNPVRAGGMGITRVDQLMADAQFSESLHRNVFIGDFANFAVDEYAETITPWSRWMNDSFVDDKLRNFNYIRGSLIVSGVLNAPPLSAGLVVISFLPTYEDTSKPVPAAYCTVVPHVVIDLSTSSDFEVTLPWVVSSDWGNLHDDLFARSWYMTTRVISPIITSVPDGCAGALLKFYARPGDDFALSGPQFQSARSRKAPILRSHAGSSSTSFSTARSRGSTNTPVNSGGAQTKVNSTFQAETGHKASEVLKIAGSVGSMMGAIPVIGGVAAAAGGIASTLGSWAEYFGFTRESTFPTPTPVLISTFQNVMNCDGNDASAIASLFQDNAVSVDPAINGALSGLDETALSHVYSRYTYIGKFNYTVGDTEPQDQLVPITPCLMRSIGGDVMQTTSAGYIGARFAQWRGDMKYLFYPVVSPIHRGKFQFIWQPVPDDGDIDVDLTNVSINSIVDVSVASPIEITIGYNNDNPMCFTDFYALDTPLSSADYSTINGYLRVRSLIPMTGSICGQIIDVLVFAAAGENMQFACPTDTMVVEGEFLEFGEQIDIDIPFQSATVGAGGQSMISVALIPSSGSYPMADILVGEEVLSVRALIQKPSVCAINDSDASDNDETTGVGPYRPGRPCNYFYYFGSMYLAFAGSVRSKIIIDRRSIPDDMSLLEATPTITPLFAANGSYPLGQFNPVVNEAAVVVEVIVPYYHNEKFVPAYKGTIPKTRIQWPTNTPATFRLIRYMSAGPDARLTFFRCQNDFVVLDAPLPLSPLFQEFPINGGVAPGFAPLKTAASVKTAKQITLDQYRARTGRSAFKQPSPSRRRAATELDVSSSKPLSDI